MIRKTLRDDSEIQIGDTKNSLDAKNGVVRRNVNLLLTDYAVLVEFLRFFVNYIRNLSIPLLLCVKVDFDCSLFVAQN